MFAAGALCVEGEKARAAQDATRAKIYGAGGAAFVFIFTFVFGATWLTVPWLYPAEIFPLEVRAKGNAWGVAGWSVGNGWLCLISPVMFKNITSYTLFIFGVANILSIPMVWALYPESNQRTLEEMNLLFAADSPWNWDAERNFAMLKEQNPDLVQAARRGQSVVDPETGLPTSRRRSGRMSLAVNELHDTSSDEKLTAYHHKH